MQMELGLAAQDAVAPDIRADRLLAWVPAAWRVAPDWQPLLTRFLASDPAHKLGEFIRQRLAQGAVIYPPQPLRALELTPQAAVRVVIVGQDPYHGPGQAEGLAFSVAPGVRPPPSLRNIFKELTRAGHRAAATGPSMEGSLAGWARQGVLLLNSCLTVEDGQPGSHANQGWEALTGEMIISILKTSSPVVFMLWGAQAQKLVPVIEQFGAVAGLREGAGRHKILTANHPSPLSALRPPQPFIGCDHFEQANVFLRQKECTPVLW